MLRYHDERGEVSGIEKHVFEPEYAISNNLIELSRKELCALVAEICRQVNAEVGRSGYRGGIYPENISKNKDGIIAIGPSRKGDWAEEELRYIAPEIYWNNKPCPQSDVYSIGLLLYYGASAGKLPFEGESNNAQLMRMSGKTVYSPAAAGIQLGNIIEKCLRFKALERYSSPEELAVMLDYCEDKRLLNSSGSQTIFHKEETELSEMELLMMDIINSEDRDNFQMTATETDVTAGDTAIHPLSEQTEEEIFSAAGLQKPEPHLKERESIKLEDYFGLDRPDPIDQAELEAEEEIRVYEPGKKQDIPILTEDPEPELAPVTVNKKKKAGKTNREPELTEQRKRPFLVVLLLLAVLLIAAVVARILIYAFSDNEGRVPSNVTIVNPTSEPSETFDVSSILSEEQIQYQQQMAEQQTEPQEPDNPVPSVDPATLPHSYEAIRADVSWKEAQSEAAAKGGYLVTINSEEELQTVINLAREAGFDRVWIGAHRENGSLLWESGEDVGFYRWDDGEPSYTDSGDGASEDYIMLWERNGQWVYNDSRENPLTDFYGMYGGRIGYIVEKVG